jgi:hypothetical protein
LRHFFYLEGTMIFLKYIIKMDMGTIQKGDPHAKKTDWLYSGLCEYLTFGH